MKTFFIRLSLSRLTYSELADLAQVVHDGFIALIAIFAMPNPTMVIFKGQIDALRTAITNWGPKGDRGSHADHLALINAAAVVRSSLRMLAEYAMNTKPDDPATWALLGFSIKRPKSKPVFLKAVQNLRLFFAGNNPEPFIKIKWKRPLDTQKADVKAYVVVRNNTGVYPTPINGHAIINVVGVVTDTQFIDNDPFVGQNWYWVIPVNAIGFGILSESVMAVSTKIA